MPTSEVSRNGPLHVDPDGRVPEPLGDVNDVAVKRRHSSVVDEDVDVSELVVGRVDEPVQLVPVGDVAGVGQCAPAGRLLDLVRGGSAIVELARRDDDICTRLGKPLHHRATESAAAAGDERDATVEAEQLSRRPSRQAGGGAPAGCNRIGLMSQIRVLNHAPPGRPPRGRGGCVVR